MTDHELRTLVRDAVARHLGPRSDRIPESPGYAEVIRPAAPTIDHASHAVYLTVVNVDDACVIEPSVSCTHCNYCRSHGH